MSTLASQIESTLSENLWLPEELSLLFDWGENRGFFVDTDNGRLGFLSSWSEMKSSWTNTGRDGGTDINFSAEGNVNLHSWFGHSRPEVLERLYVFSQTGADGSMAAFWLDDLGKQRIVHIGSGSGSIMCCVLADTTIDFLRLVAIGYAEICWGEEFAFKPNSNPATCDFTVAPNIEFQEWVKSKFCVDIPTVGAEIVKLRSTNSYEDPLD